MPAKVGGRRFPWGRLVMEIRRISHCPRLRGIALMISPQSLIAEGLLDASECYAHFAPGPVDYASVIPFKERVASDGLEPFPRNEARRCAA